MDPTTQLVVTATTLLAVAAIGQVVLRRTPIPSILFFLVSGVILGPSVLNLIAPDTMGEVLFAIVRLSVAIIVFEGAFSLEGDYLRQVRRPVRNLVTVGLIVTVIGGTLIARWVAGLSWSLAIQYATLVSVTGPTVITPLLQRVRVNGRVRATLAGEGVIIDPIGAVVALVTFQIIQSPEPELRDAALWAGQRLAIGALWGFAGGLVLLLLLRRLGSEPSQVARLVTLAGAAVIFTTIDAMVHESGLAAVVVAGLWLGNREFPYKHDVHQFKGDITVIVIATVYLLLAATLDLDDLARLGWNGVLAVLLMMAIVRPLGVLLSTARSILSFKERLFVGAIGPRGVVAASLATLVSLRLEGQGVVEAQALLGLVFLTIVISIAIQASYAGWLSNVLGVRPMQIVIVGAGRVGRMLAQEMLTAGEEVTMIERHPERAEQARDLGVRVIVGDGTKAEVLDKAGIEQARTVVAATASDQDNLLVCQLAKTRFNRERLVARVMAPEAVPSFEALGIQVMNPARSTAMILANLIRRPNLFRLLSEISSNGDDVTEVVVRSPTVDGRQLSEIRLSHEVLVLLIRRGSERLIPHGDTELKLGDVVTLVGSHPATDRAVRLLTG